jgi:dCTP deaminase
MIAPYSPAQKREGVISYGVSSYGYDVRLGYRFKVFTDAFCGVIDPKNMPKEAFVEVDCSPRTEQEQKTLMIPPNSFVLGESLEEFAIPRDVLVLVVGKSTVARCGLIVNVTPGEPEWRGRWTVEISNTANLPAKVYPGEGIMQCVFLRAESLCRESYADKQGKYQGQGGLQLPKVDGLKS